jgi:NADH:ubiquinone oxidoreductase subunit H
MSIFEYLVMKKELHCIVLLPVISLILFIISAIYEDERMPYSQMEAQPVMSNIKDAQAATSCLA